jgi:hypothetical protein
MNIKETFLKLTSRTYPHGTENILFPYLQGLGLEFDQFGNMYKMIGESDVMFTSHLDTATSQECVVNHVIEGDIIKTDGNSILGADDKAGVVIMLNMIENNIPGLYYFFLGEEVGCIGSKALSSYLKNEENRVGIYNLKKVISFDRRATSSVITYQGGMRCCSETFAKSLSEELNKYESTFKYSPDPTGVYTDSAQFVNIYPECTNVSVGYYKEHTKEESQDIDHLIKLSKAVLSVDWNSLPSERDMTKVDYRYSGGWGSYYDDDDYFDRMSNKNRSSNTPSYSSSYYNTSEDTFYFYDEDFQYVSSYKISNKTKMYIDVDLDPARLEKENNLIHDFLKMIDLDYMSMSWDGLKLNVSYFDKADSSATRNDLQSYIPELDLEKCVKEFEKVF